MKARSYTSKPALAGMKGVVFSPLLSVLILACEMDPSAGPPIIAPSAQKDAAAEADAASNNMDSGNMQIDSGIMSFDAGLIPDGGLPPRPDTGAPFTTDAGSPASTDAEPTDTGLSINTDATAPDANVIMDAMPNSNPDAGFAADAETPDTGSASDASVTVDAGLSMPPVGDPFDPVTRAAEIANAECAFQNRCEPFRFLYRQITLSDCVNESTQNYRASFDLYAQMIAAGNTAFQQGEFDACIAALGNADCELGLDANACNFVVGQRTQNQPCIYSAECAPDQYCSANGLAVCGQCEARAQLQQNCTNAPCVEGATCAQTTGGNAICVPEFANENTPCGDTLSGFCRGQLQCRDPQNLNQPICVRPAQAGQLCSTNSINIPNCNFNANQFCFNSSCTTINWVNAGGSCSGPNGCTSSNICDQNTTTCVALPTNNQLCARSTCAVGNYCDGTLCRTKLGAGATCTSNVQCSGSLYCTGPLGARTCGDLTWQMCP